MEEHYAKHQNDTPENSPTSPSNKAKKLSKLFKPSHIKSFEQLGWEEADWDIYATPREVYRIFHEFSFIFY